MNNTSVTERGGEIPGMITDFAGLHPDFIVTEESLATIFRCSIRTIRREVKRGHLPQSCKMFRGARWTVKVIMAHFDQRLETAAKEQKKLERTLHSC